MSSPLTTSTSGRILATYQLARALTAGVVAAGLGVVAVGAGWGRGWAVVVPLACITIHAVASRRRGGGSPRATFLLDVTLVGLAAALLGVPLATGLGFGSLAVGSAMVLGPRDQRWFLPYGAAWLAVAVWSPLEAWARPSILSFRGFDAVFTMLLVPTIWVFVRSGVRVLRRAEGEAEGSEARYRSLFELAPVAMWEVDWTRLADWVRSLPVGSAAELRAHLMGDPAHLAGATRRVRVVSANVAAGLLEASDGRAMFGGTRVGERSGHEVIPLVEQAVAVWEGEGRGSVPAIMLDRRGRAHSGVLEWFVDVDEDGEPNHASVRVAFVDTTERDRLARLAWAASVSETVVLDADTEEELLGEVCRLMVEEGGYALAWVGYAEPDPGHTVRPIARFGDVGYVDSIVVTWDDSETGRGPTGTAIRTGEIVVSQDYAADTRFHPWRGEAARKGYRSSAAIPLVFGGGILGALNVYSVEPGRFGPDEMEVLQRLGANISLGIHALRARDFCRQTNDRLHDLNHAKDEFIASVAHELRTPLTEVVGFAEELASGWDGFTAEERESCLGMIAAQGNELGLRISDLTTMARLGLAGLTVRTQEVDLRREVMGVLRFGLGREDLRVTVGDATVLAAGDPVRIGQIVHNLVANVVRHGGSAMRVACLHMGDAAVLEVWDDGPGIPEGEGHRVFEAYEKAPGEETLPDTIGLGLTVARSLARAMQGDLAYRRDGDWTVFSLSLPLA